MKLRSLAGLTVLIWVSCATFTPMAGPVRIETRDVVVPITGSPLPPGRFLREKQIEWSVDGPASGLTVRVTVQFGLEKTAGQLKLIGKKTAVKLRSLRGDLPWAAWIKDHRDPGAFVTLTTDNDGAELWPVPSGWEIRRAAAVIATLQGQQLTLRLADPTASDLWLITVLASFAQHSPAYLEP